MAEGGVMKKPSRILRNHLYAVILFMGGLAGVVMGTVTLFRVILPYADSEAIFLAQVFAGIAWILAWVIRGVWQTSRDYTVDDMGPITLKTYIGEIQQVYENKYGKE